MNRHFIVIFNARAGRRKRSMLERIRAWFEDHGLDHSATTLDDCDWDDVRRLAGQRDEVRFVVAGGDGTLRLTMERLWQNGLLDTCPVGFVPLGSANIAALSFGLPRRLVPALEHAVHGAPKAVDLGVIDGKSVFFIAAIFGAVSSVTVNAGREMKKRFGALAYLFCVRQLMASPFRDANFTLDYDDNGKRKHVRSHSMIFCNQLNIGGLRSARKITADDAQLDLITLHNTRGWGLFRAAYDFFRVQADTRVLRHRRVTAMKYHLKDFAGRIHLDGDECLSVGETVDLKVMPGAVRFVG